MPTGGLKQLGLLTDPALPVFGAETAHSNCERIHGP